jgi:hypothetical protein
MRSPYALRMSNWILRSAQNDNQEGLVHPSTMLARLRSLWLLVFWSLGPSLCAHDPYEAFTAIVIRADRLELTLTMARSTALKLIDPELRIRALTPENVAEHRPPLEREGRLLFILTSLRTQLAAQKINVELTEENDITFTVTYPRPAPGRLLVHAAYLRKLGEGYGGIVTIDDEANRNLGWEQLLWERPNFEAAIPAAASSPKK